MDAREHRAAAGSGHGTQRRRGHRVGTGLTPSAGRLAALIVVAFGPGLLALDRGVLSLVLRSFAVEPGMVAVDLCLGAIKRFLRPCERLVAGLQQGSRAMIDTCIETLVAFVGPTRSVLKLPERLLNAHSVGWTLRVSAFTGRGFHCRTHSRLR